MTSLLPQITDIQAALARGERRISLPGMKGSAPACVLAELLRARSGNLLVIAADQDAADEFCRELGFFGAGDATPLAFPAWDCQPFGAASPQPGAGGGPAGGCGHAARSSAPDLQRGILLPGGR
jgi:transcription-repair coupling factor (superfamily II helicase)